MIRVRVQVGGRDQSKIMYNSGRRPWVIRDQPVIKGQIWPRVKDRSKQDRLAGGAPALLLSIITTLGLSSQVFPEAVTDMDSNPEA